MLKASAIKRLTNNNIANSLAPFFEAHSFKYVKGKQSFIKIFDKEITQIVEISKVEWGFDDDTNNHYLFFELRFGIEAQSFSKWLLEQTGIEFRRNMRRETPVQETQCYLTLDLMKIPVEDVNMYGMMSPSQRFKNFIAFSLSGPKYPDKDSIISVDEFIKEIAQNTLNHFNNCSNLQFIFEHRPHEFSLDYLHIQTYIGNIEIAKSYYQKHNEYFINEIRELMKMKSKDLADNLDYYKVFIKVAEKFTDTKYENPFESYGTIKLLTPQKQEIRITDSIVFEEIGRYDISEVKMKQYLINNEGAVIFHYNKDKIFHINKEENIAQEIVIEYPSEEEKYDINKLKILNGTDFLVNNYIIKSNNQIIQLSGDDEQRKNKRYKHLSTYYNVDYDSLKQKYYVVDEFIWIYDLNGNFESIAELPQNQYPSNESVRISYDPKERIQVLPNDQGILLRRYKDKKFHNCLINYDGKIIFEIEVNDNFFLFSNNSNFLFEHGDRGKAYLYDFKNKNKCIAMDIHPLKWKAYKDLHFGARDEYGVRKVEFSPDEEYIAAGVTFEKYIVWQLPTGNRIELFPSEDSLKKMGISIIEIDGKKILKSHTKYRTQKIHFFDNGDIFVIIHNNGSILVWNRKFENINFIGALYDITIHNEQFMSQVVNGELIIYKRIVQ